MSIEGRLMFMLICGVGLAVLADQWKNRSMLMWFIIGFFSSIIGLIVLALLPALPKVESTDSLDHDRPA